MIVKHPNLTRRKFLLGLAGMGLVTWDIGAAEAFSPFEPFTFAYISDVHLCNDIPDSFILTHESQLFLQQLVKELNSEKVDFVMFGGDQVETPGRNEGNWTLFSEIVGGLNAPWSFVLGDRDVSGSYGVDKVRTYGADWRDHGIKTTNSYWSLNPEFLPGVHLVGLDTSLPNTTLGGMSARQLDWLKNDLAENKRLFTMVFAHHPLLPPPPYDGGPPWDDYVIPDGGAVREIIAPNSQVKMVLSGHVHVTKVQSEKDIWHLANPSLSVYPCAYRIFRVTPQKVAMETRQIEFPALIKKARKALIDSAMASRYNRSNPDAFVSLVEGSREDRDSLIPMIPGRQLESYNPKKAAKQRPREEPQTQPQTQQPSSTAANGEPEEKGGLFHRKKKGNATQPRETRPQQSPNASRKNQQTQPEIQPDDSAASPQVPDEVEAPRQVQPTKGGEPRSSEKAMPDTAPTGNSATPPPPLKPKKKSTDDEIPTPPPPAKPEDIDKILEGGAPAGSSDTKSASDEKGEQPKATDKTKK